MNVLSLPDRPAGNARLPGDVVWLSKMNINPIRVSGGRNGVDGYGRKWFNGIILKQLVGTCLSGFEMGNSGKFFAVD